MPRRTLLTFGGRLRRTAERQQVIRSTKRRDLDAADLDAKKPGDRSPGFFEGRSVRSEVALDAEAGLEGVGLFVTPFRPAIDVAACPGLWARVWSMWP